MRSVLKYPWADERTSTTLVKNFGLHHALLVPYFSSITPCLALIYRSCWCRCLSSWATLDVLFTDVPARALELTYRPINCNILRASLRYDETYFHFALSGKSKQNMFKGRRTRWAWDRSSSKSQLTIHIWQFRNGSSWSGAARKPSAWLGSILARLGSRAVSS